MRVISIRQPWAALLALGIKRFEARTWTTPYRGDVLVHASSHRMTVQETLDLEVSPDLVDALHSVDLATFEAIEAFPTSAIIGKVTITEVLPSTSCDDFTSLDEATCGAPADGLFLWRVTGPRAITPIPCGGKLNLWTLPKELEPKVQRALASTAVPRWAKPRKGDFLTYELCVPSKPMQEIIGTGRFSRRGAVRRFVEYAIGAGALLEGGDLILNSRLQFLAPGRERLTVDEAETVVMNHFPAVEGAVAE